MNLKFKKKKKVKQTGKINNFFSIKFQNSKTREQVDLPFHRPDPPEWT